MFITLGHTHLHTCYERVLFVIFYWHISMIKTLGEKQQNIWYQLLQVHQKEEEQKKNK